MASPSYFANLCESHFLLSRICHHVGRVPTLKLALFLLHFCWALPRVRGMVHWATQVLGCVLVAGLNKSIVAFVLCHKQLVYIGETQIQELVNCVLVQIHKAEASYSLAWIVNKDWRPNTRLGAKEDQIQKGHEFIPKQRIAEIPFWSSTIIKGRVPLSFTVPKAKFRCYCRDWIT